MAVDMRKICGTIQSGRGEAGQFLNIGWVREQLRRICGFTAFPGTLNLVIGPEDAGFIRRLACARGERVIPPSGEDGFCEARLLSLRVDEYPAALVFPMVNDYYEHIAEIIAPVKLKEQLGKKDGDTLLFQVAVPEKLPLPAGVIFDLDGTLIDSIDLYYSILCEGLQQLNLPVPEKKWTMEMMGAGTGFWEAWENLTYRSVEESQREEFRRRSVVVFEEIWQRRYEREVRLFPGVARLLTRLHNAGVSMGIVTSSFYANKMNLFGRNGLHHEELFQSIITRRDTQRHKPDPEPVRLCLEQLGLEKDNCIYMGDSPCDIAAGRDCGLLTAGLLTGTGTRQSLSQEGASMILDDVTRLQEYIKL